MKTYYVYEIYNTLGTVEYVGESINPTHRLYRHTKVKPVKGAGCGALYGRQDLSLNIVAQFTDRKEARALEGQLKLKYGLEWTENHNSKKWGIVNGPINGKKQSQKVHTCPYCAMTGKSNFFTFNHVNNCKHKPIE